jgi:hypothetical protein
MSNATGILGGIDFNGCRRTLVKISTWSSTCVALACLAACSASPGITAATVPPTLDEVGNATVVGVFEDPVTLRNGRWDGEPYVPGGAARPTAGVIEDFSAAGDLDGDGTGETIAFLWSATGGSGTRNYIAVFTNSGDGVSNPSTLLIGDRVKLREVRIADKRIEVDLVQHGPDDAMCCPSEESTRMWLYDGKSLREVPP